MPSTLVLHRGWRRPVRASAASPGRRSRPPRKNLRTDSPPRVPIVISPDRLRLPLVARFFFSEMRSQMPKRRSNSRELPDEYARGCADLDASSHAGIDGSLSLEIMPQKDPYCVQVGLHYAGRHLLLSSSFLPQRYPFDSRNLTVRSAVHDEAGDFVFGNANGRVIDLRGRIVVPIRSGGSRATLPVVPHFSARWRPLPGPASRILRLFARPGA